MQVLEEGGGGPPPEILSHLERNGVPTTLSVCGQFFVILYTIGVGVGVRMGCPFVVSLRPSSCPGTAVEHRTAPIAARGNDGWVTGVVDSHNLTYGAKVATTARAVLSGLGAASTAVAATTLGDSRGPA